MKLTLKGFITLLVIGFIFYIGFIGITRSYSKSLPNNKTNIVTKQGIDFSNENDISNSNSITISAAGDCTLGNDEDADFRGSFIDVFNKNNNDYNYFLKNVKPIFTKDDMTIVNLETTLTTATKRMDKEFTFKGYPEFTNILLKGGIDTVNISNNHIHDYFESGFKDTINNLKQAKIDFCGEGYLLSKKIKNIKIGLLGFRVWENNSYMKKIIKRSIEKLKKNGNQLIIISFHWGEEMKYYPNDIQKDIGKFAIDCGADLILGTHPHVIEGIEKYKGKYIIYSLGNFSFGGSRNPPDKDTFVLQESFGVTNGKLNSYNTVKIIPCSISSVKGRNNYQPTPLFNKEKASVIDRLRLLSKPFNTVIDENGIVK